MTLGKTLGQALGKVFNTVASGTARAAGRPLTFGLCCLIVVVWGISGPIFHFSDTWQLVINTGTTIVTFLMVFLIQNTQNRDGAAIQAKLDEIIRTSAAQNAFIGIEHLTEAEVEEFRALCERRAKVANEAAEHALGRAHRRAGEAADEAA